MTTTFAQLGLPDPLVRALGRAGIHEPFPVQAATIPDALAGTDVCGKAPTGSGKTLAFGLPVLATVDEASRHRPRALVLAPTRELADQITQELAPLAKAVERRVFAVYGGVGYGPQKAALRRGIDVLIATPGRLEDLIEQRVIDLRDVEIAVIDEADRMADMGFMPAVRRILDRTARHRQTLLFSATLDGDIAVLSRDYQHAPARHEATSVESETVEARHHFWLVEHANRVTHTAEVVNATGRSIVFTRTRHGADRLARQLAKLGVGAVSIHGGRSQSQRTRALRAFSTGGAQALVATDVAARGIHVDAVATVIHFDPPTDAKDYLHRSGRTARAGATGTVVSLVSSDQRRTVTRMQRDLALDAPIDRPSLDALAAGGYQTGTASPGRSRPERTPNTSRSTRSDAGAERRPVGGSRPSGRARGNVEGTVYVANLPWSATANDVEDLFGRYGTVKSAMIVTDRITGRSRGFGFVDMPDPGAGAAIAALHGATFEGRDLTVKAARPRAGR